ncbi:hypothetical protein K466DRAFT_313965 [Polyporus arcularius HHB13444]|uniref:Uncharacterized protein n=1 Tax=Polyporus arcularius HHB13444 TaxID=1314778 RepID=A0A5C3PQ60_9APHY|nr:hypothetical protein K466DRAFT_313965 [Polyporus arcularius HHB13444]
MYDSEVHIIMMAVEGVSESLRRAIGHGDGRRLAGVARRRRGRPEGFSVQSVGPAGGTLGDVDECVQGGRGDGGGRVGVVAAGYLLDGASGRRACAGCQRSSPGYVLRCPAARLQRCADARCCLQLVISEALMSFVFAAERRAFRNFVCRGARPGDGARTQNPERHAIRMCIAGTAVASRVPHVVRRVPRENRIRTGERTASRKAPPLSRTRPQLLGHVPRRGVSAAATRRADLTGHSEIQSPHRRRAEAAANPCSGVASMAVGDSAAATALLIQGHCDWPAEAARSTRGSSSRRVHAVCMRQKLQRSASGQTWNVAQEDTRGASSALAEPTAHRSSVADSSGEPPAHADPRATRRALQGPRCGGEAASTGGHSGVLDVRASRVLRAWEWEPGTPAAPILGTCGGSG